MIALEIKQPKIVVFFVDGDRNLNRIKSFENICCWIELRSPPYDNLSPKSEAIANVSGSRLGSIRKAETDVFQITARYSTEISNSGSYSTTSIDKDIR